MPPTSQLDWLSSTPAMIVLLAAGIARDVRGDAGSSDHAPVWIELAEAESGSRGQRGA
jgi:exodeoxyribonuclease-3